MSGISLKSTNNILKYQDDLESRVPQLQRKVSKMYDTSETKYNPFLDKDGNLFNKYIDYQKVLDNPNITSKAKQFIMEATGLTPTTQQATTPATPQNNTANGVNYMQYTRTSNVKTNNGTNTSSGIPVVDTAKQYLGTPYVWGGTSPKGFDCSGLVQYAYAQNGISIPRTSQEQFKSGTAVSAENLQAGDLVFFKGSSGTSTEPGHVGMYIGNGEYIQAPKTGDVVKISKMSGRSDYVGARRYY